MVNTYYLEDRDVQEPNQGGVVPMPTTSHQHIYGVQVYTDAAIAQHQQRYLPRKTGIGIHMQDNTSCQAKELLIQATHLQALDPLHAETLSIQMLNLNQVSYH
jgi:hypothetical protein